MTHSLIIMDSSRLIVIERIPGGVRLERLRIINGL